MEKRLQKPSGLKISQLAELAGVPIPTIKHYLKEGLLPRPVKTGRTMSYYDPACAEKIRLIKCLRTQRFFPLSVIKRIIDSGATAGGELELGAALLNVPSAPANMPGLTKKQIRQETGFSAERIDRMEALGLISSRTAARGKEYDAADSRIIGLVRQREKIGLPFDYSLQMMSIYRKYIRKIVREDAQLFVRRMLSDSSPEDAARYIREGDRALEAFMPLMKAKLMRAHAENLLEKLNQAPRSLKEILHFRTVKELPFPGAGDENRKRINSGWMAVASGHFQEALMHLQQVKKQNGLQHISSVLEGLALYGTVADTPGIYSALQPIVEARTKLYASHMPADNLQISMLTSYLRGGGLSILPEIFDTHKKAASDLRAVAYRNPGSKTTGQWHSFMKELKLKALFHLAQMLMDDEEHDQARHQLHLLKESGKETFYGKWALRMLKKK